VPQPGVPYSPDDPNGERSFMMSMPVEQLPPPDLSGGVQLADREGVFAQSFKCRACTLHFVLFSWSRTRHTPETIACPECGSCGRFMHRTTELSGSQQFRMDPSRDPEIYDVWPFRTGGTR
jgi:DNA-directed RNA polymerase subunit RPC12/RpoP